MTIQIVIKHDVGKGAPGESLGHSYGHDYKAGDEVWIGFIPEKGYRGDEVKDLSFWTSSDVDYALIFSPNEIAEVRIEETDPRLEFIQRKWTDGPIKVLPAKFWLQGK